MFIDLRVVHEKPGSRKMRRIGTATELRRGSVEWNPTFGSVSELAIWRKARTLPATCAFSRKCRVPRWVRPGKPDIEKPREP